MDENDGPTNPIAAHKLLLSGSTPVFMKQFFGPMKENRTEVKIEDTTVQAFATMINYIYEKPESFSLTDIKCPQKLCEILAIAERYQVTGLVHMTENTLNELKITPENMIFSVATSKNYATFEDAAKMLYRKCQLFCFENLKTADDVYSLVLMTHNNFPEADPKLLPELLKSNADKCQNCLRVKVFCLD